MQAFELRGTTSFPSTVTTTREARDPKLRLEALHQISVLVLPFSQVHNPPHSLVLCHPTMLAQLHPLSPAPLALMETPLLFLLPFIRNITSIPTNLPPLRISNSAPPLTRTTWPLPPFQNVMSQMLPPWTLVAGLAFRQQRPQLLLLLPPFNLMKPAMQKITPQDSMDMNEGMQWGSGAEIGRGSDFDFENGRVKPWEGERIHEVGMEELELTLGCGKA
ncbi:brassinazole-resistant 1 protein [Sesbania bispinosa]|nr:brassinazole-resistant 1 protein [Sesbania bispinosa]